MRAARVVVVVTIVGMFGAGLAACGKSQADKFKSQLGKAGYTDVSVKADYDTKYNKKKKKNVKQLDDYEATAKAGTCSVEIEQDVKSKSYVIETAANQDVSFKNLTARALIVELNKQGITC